MVRGRSPAAEAFFQWATRFGESDWLLIPPAVFVLLLALGDWRAVRTRVATAWAEAGDFALLAFVTIAAPGLVTNLFKALVGRFRPPHLPVDAFGGAFAFSPLSFGGYAYYSFPSGHATTMGAAAILAVVVLGRWAVPVVAAAAVVASSRVVIGVHFPSDVVAGAFLGAGIGYLILMAGAASGIGLVMRRGKLRTRFGAISALVRRDGIGALFSGLVAAFVGRRSG